MNKWLVASIAFLVGWLVALVALQFRFLNFTLDITLGNLVQAAATVALGFLIPFAVTKGLDASKRQKEMLVTELESLKTASDEIIGIIKAQCSAAQPLSTEQRQQLLAQFERISRLTGHLKKYYDKLTKGRNVDWVNSLESARNSLKDTVTGGELFVATYVVTSAFLEKCTIEHERYGSSVNCVILETIEI